MMDVNTARQHLRERAWKHPRDYGGFSPDGDYLLASRHRESDALARSNYRVLYAEFKAEAYDDDRERNTFAERPAVYDWRAGHWAVGWVEYLMVRQDAPAATLIAAAEALRKLAAYPVYSEDDFSALEWDEACQYWERCSVRERMELCERAGISCFAARRAEMPAEALEALI